MALTAAVKVVFEHPTLIQELEGWPAAVDSASGNAPTRDSASQILFGFCDGTLYRMVVSYDRERLHKARIINEAGFRF